MPVQRPQQQTGAARVVYLALGWLFFGLCMLGVVLPVLPTTPFLLLALWAFSRSSARLHHWLYQHRIFGPALQRWHQHRIIPMHAKLFIVLAMGTSFVYVIGFSRLPAGINFVVVMIMMAVATYLLSRPSSLKPEEERTE
ncbi:YbaN family protein [Sedimenticola selenatireducens]|uniref:Inner membrane protein n=1 Tax=Sedimenticola selenatireducens TaxID=191960 RepID=A0A2N6CSH2_9GAMM|nr:YbaN family protein [Sedimenticola selenatireducens]PLX60018.1 MAG: DUF454 domain-containing protein [Sedimenticola selenatireducens]